MDPFNKTKESILINAQIENTDYKSLAIFDIPNKKLIPLKIKEIKNLRNSGICKIKRNIYMIVGGYTQPDMTIKKNTYIIDINSELFMQMPLMHIPRLDCHCVYYKNRVYVISGRKSIKENEFTNQCEYFDMSLKRWVQMKNCDKEIKSIERIFVENNKIMCVISKNDILCYDIKTDNWNLKKNFTYTFNSFYVINSNECLLINSHCNSVCRYDYFSDTVLFDLAIHEYDALENFYIQEIDCLFFLNGSTDSSFLVLDCSTRTIYFYDDSAYKKIFKGYLSIYTAANYFLNTPNDVRGIKNRDILNPNNVFIYGNYDYPLSLVLDLSEEDISWELFPIPEKLHLKSEQGVVYQTANQFMFAGGYDKIRFNKTKDTYSFNPYKNVIDANDSLVKSVSGTSLKRVVIPPSTFNFRRNDEDYCIFLASDYNSYQAFTSITKKWIECPDVGSTVIPNILDVDTAVVVFYINKEHGIEQPKTLLFKVYDYLNNKWINIYEKITHTEISHNFCCNIDAESYLVATRDKDSSIMITQMDLKFSNNSLEDVAFQPLAVIDTNIKSKTLNFFMDKGYIIIIYVNNTLGLTVKAFDMITKKFVNNERVTKIKKALNDAFGYLRLKNPHIFDLFSLYCSNVKTYR